MVFPTSSCRLKTSCFTSPHTPSTWSSSIFTSNDWSSIGSRLIFPIVTGSKDVSYLRTVELESLGLQAKGSMGLSSYFKHTLGRPVLQNVYFILHSNPNGHPGFVCPDSPHKKESQLKGGPLPLGSLKAFQELRSYLCSEPMVSYPQKNQQ